MGNIPGWNSWSFQFPKDAVAVAAAAAAAAAAVSMPADLFSDVGLTQPPSSVSPPCTPVNRRIIAFGEVSTDLAGPSTVDNHPGTDQPQQQQQAQQQPQQPEQRQQSRPQQEDQQSQTQPQQHHHHHHHHHLPATADSSPPSVHNTAQFHGFLQNFAMAQLGETVAGVGIGVGVQTSPCSSGEQHQRSGGNIASDDGSVSAGNTSGVVVGANDPSSAGEHPPGTETVAGGMASAAAAFRNPAPFFWL
ncbi:hypothetical protein HDU87_005960 [Geranomyces variabilis]|uniref:Uncharacterized protein n=1 Tax=Geranomyces variabilis TaxID=109894 RepID=A0AAD5TQU0_9FUNG|nr:hypothetical protein HDU87_005960 [Geranomyces variabilis]